jgi:hypothetical protein
MAATAKRASVARSHALDREPLQDAAGAGGGISAILAPVAGAQAGVTQAPAVAFASPSPSNFASASASIAGKASVADRPVVYEVRLATIPGLGSLWAVANRSFRPRPQPVEPATPLLGSINLTPAGAGPGEQFQTEITAAVTLGDRVFLLSSGGGSTLQVTDATQPAALRLVGREPLGTYTVQSVAAYGNLVAAALSPAGYNEATNLSGMRGVVRFYRLDTDGTLDALVDVPVGYLPDSLAFTAAGDQLVVANEGQPNWGPAGPIANGQPTYPQAYTVDPQGSIGIIDIKGTVNLRFTYTDLALGSLALPAGIRLAGPEGTSQAEFLEPEYVTIEGTTAYVTLQESNGVAKVDLLRRQIVDLLRGEITDVFALGAVDFSTQAVDLSDRDGPPDSQGRPTSTFAPKLGQPFQGLRMPDGIDAFRTRGKEYFITANEGDAQVYADNDNAVYLDEIRFGGTSSGARLKTIADPPVITAGADPSLGAPFDGTPTNQAFGGRSVSVFDATTGALVWDSGNSLQTIAVAARTYDDGRSDDKGVEPETVVVAEVNGRQLAVVGLERGLKTTLVLFDVTDPAAATYRSHIVIDGSVSPEGLTVIPAEKSSTGRAVLAVSNEISNTLNLLDLETLAATPGIGSAGYFTPTMLKEATGGPELSISSLLTNGEFTAGLEPGSPVYAPTGIFDGMGAYDNGDGTYTLLVNSEVAAGRGYQYFLDVKASGGTGFDQKIVDGARINQLIIDKDLDDNASNGYQSAVIGGGLAYDKVVTNDATPGFDRFCSANLMEANTFGAGLGFVDRTYLVGEETSANGGGIFYALDVAGRSLHQVAGVGKGAWESATLVDTGNTGTVAMLLFDDGSAAPDQGSPLYLWMGAKEAGSSDFLRRNGLAPDQGSLYVWKTDEVANTPAGLDSVALGAPVAGYWVLVGSGSAVASGTGKFATADAQRTYALDTLGAMQFLRIEDGDVNPLDGSQAAFNTTGGTYSAAGGINTASGDYYGTTYTIDFSGAFNDNGQLLTDADNAFTDLRVISDADRLGDNAITGVRSPDNLAWGSDGFLYVQEDKSTFNGTASGQFGPQEASIWKLNPNDVDSITGAAAERWAQVDRTAVPTAYGQSDGNPSQVGNWETSGIIEVSDIFGAAPGSVFLSTVQAHSLTNGNIGGDPYLVEGGQIDLIQQLPPVI